MAGKDEDRTDMVNDFPNWDREFPQQSVDAIYEWGIANARLQIDWYARKIKHKRFYSVGARKLSLLFVAIA
jgi:hypothetical protein